MSLFVDTGVFYAHHDRDSARHDAATAAMETAGTGTYGQLFTSDYVYDEAVTLTRSRTDHEAAARLGDRILGRGSFPSATEVLFVDPPIFDDAVDVFERYDDQRLSFTDATTVALVEAHGIDSVLSFDDDFDGLIPRLQPAEV